MIFIMSRFFEIVLTCSTLEVNEVLDIVSSKTPYVAEIKYDKISPKTKYGTLRLFINGELQDILLNDWIFKHLVSIENRNWDNYKEIHFKIKAFSPLDGEIIIVSSSKRNDIDLLKQFFDRIGILSMCRSKEQYHNIREIITALGPISGWCTKLSAERLWSYTQMIMDWDENKNIVSEHLYPVLTKCYFQNQSEFLQKLAHE